MWLGLEKSAGSWVGVRRWAPALFLFFSYPPPRQLRDSGILATRLVEACLRTQCACMGL